MPTGKHTFKQRYWTLEEQAFLLEHYEAKGADWCAQALTASGSPRTCSGCQQMAIKMELVYHGPKLGCFKKGQVPANKGKKMPEAIYQKAKPTMFKKGTLNGKAKMLYSPIGTESFRTDEYWWVKVADKKWELKHRVLWEKHNGPIPPGMLVVFKDGNPHNFNLDNFELITRQQAVKRNRWGGGPSEYSLLNGRAARSRLNKRGITDKHIRQNPELLQMATAETLLKLKQRHRHDTQG